MDRDKLAQLAQLIRYNILAMTHKAGSGHPTSCFSAVELMTVLFFKHLRANLDKPEHPGNDRVIFSKGHASALLYSLYAAAGKITEKELLQYREFGSPLEGHPTKRFAFTEAATGSLGQGLSIGAGEAWAIKHGNALVGESFAAHPSNPVSTLKELDSKEDTTVLEKTHLPALDSDPQVYVLLGDGELAEGSVWEAASWASFHNLDNLIAMVDVNRLGQAQETMYEHKTDVYTKRFEAFGWATIVIDGHDLGQIDVALSKARNHKGSPSVIIAKTIKGKGIAAWEDKTGWHNRMLPPEVLEKALAEFGSVDKTQRGIVQKPEHEINDVRFTNYESKNHKSYVINHKSILYPQHELVATKKAFGNDLERLGGQYPNLIVLDGDMANSTHTDQFKKAYPDRFLQMYIAEQNMAGVAIGLAKRGFKPFISTFACFLSRAHDQFRMMPLSGVSICVNGTYVGVSMGKDGPSQMGLEDMALFRSIYDSTVLYPADPYQTEALVEEMMNRDGVVYIRTTREPTPVIYGPDDMFPIGGSKVFDSPNPGVGLIVTLVAAGITLHESLKAQKELADQGIAVRVIDCYSVKPIDEETLRKTARETRAIIVVEDHYPEGGLGEAVKSALCQEKIPIYHLAVTKLPMSGKPEELLANEGIDAENIVKTVREFVKNLK